jgi:hypothetical protein
VSYHELKNRRDIWPIVKDRIPEAISLAHSALDDVISHPDLIDHLERKFRKGEVEHDRAWLANADVTDPSWLILEAAEEILDFILYHAMFVILTDARAAESESDS